MSGDALAWAFRTRDVSPHEKLLLLILGDEAGMDGVVSIDQAHLSAATGIPTDQVDTTLLGLLKRDLLSYGAHPDYAGPVWMLRIPGAWGVPA